MRRCEVVTVDEVNASVGAEAFPGLRPSFIV